MRRKKKAVTVKFLDFKEFLFQVAFSARKFCLFAGIFPLIFLFSCSSAPKRIMLVTESTNLGYSQLDSANDAISSGNYSRAFNQLSSSYGLALSVDNTALLCKIALSGIVLKIACPDLSEIIPAISLENSAESKSFLNQSNDELLEFAKKMASRSDETEKKQLLSLSSVYEARILLSDGSSPDISSLENAKSALTKEPYYLAYLYRTLGDICMAGENYADAQKNYAEAAKVHTKERYLLEIGMDYYCLARSYSQDGKKQEAISAILTALKYDKDAENTAGIAADYQAYSKILLKGNPTEAEKSRSEEFSAWAEKILNARSN